jgi:hypothetical protein
MVPRPSTGITDPFAGILPEVWDYFDNSSILRLLGAKLDRISAAPYISGRRKDNRLCRQFVAGFHL